LNRFGRHFERVRDFKAFERRLVKRLVSEPGMLHERDEALLRYGLALAQIYLFRTPQGDDVDLSEDVESLRTWMHERILPSVESKKKVDIGRLRSAMSELNTRVTETRADLLNRHSDAFSSDHLDSELRKKRLVLSLGGGGGSGYAHLGLFSLLDELRATPELIVGSSMGSIMGLLRAIRRDYDPIGTAMALPKQLDYSSVFQPFTGHTRFGFPGAFHMNLRRVADNIFRQLVGGDIPPFGQLPIQLQIVACGVRAGFHLEDQMLERMTAKSVTPFALRKRLKVFFEVIKQLTNNPQFLAPVVFGRDAETQGFSTVEAVGFSCAVPGLLHYDVFHDDPDTVGPLEAIFAREQILRLCDGGVVNNVPSRVAWESVQAGDIGSRNTFILAADVFAPVPRGTNVLWMPVQQIARGSVMENRPYCDFQKTFRVTPSPLQVIVNRYSTLKEIIRQSRKELAGQEAYFAKTLETLPPVETWMKPTG
jgi:predicted acylesterase/phospholipase RssA